MFQNNEEIDAEENTEMTLDDDDDITYFDEPRDIIKESSVKVIQVIARDAALVNGDSNLAGGTSLKGMYLGPVYLIVSKISDSFYDDQIIKLPKGKVFRQVGVYRYTTTKDREKTVPIISIMDE